MPYTRGRRTGAASESGNAGPDLFPPCDSSLHDRELDEGKDETKTVSYEAVSCGPPERCKALNSVSAFRCAGVQMFRGGSLPDGSPHSVVGKTTIRRWCWQRLVRYGGRNTVFI